jgi:hypothetical protein
MFCRRRSYGVSTAAQANWAAEVLISGGISLVEMSKRPFMARYHALQFCSHATLNVKLFQFISAHECRVAKQ